MAGSSNNLGQQGEPFAGRFNGADSSSTIHRKNEDNGGTAVERSSLFSGLLPSEAARISAAARVKEFTRGEMLYIGGDSVQQVFLLTSGFVKVTQFGLGGKEVILRFHVPGDVLGAVGLFSRGTHCTTARVFRSSRVLVWDAPCFKALVERVPALHLNMVRIIEGDLLELQERFQEVATEKVGPRVARQVVRLTETMGGQVNGGVEIGLSREELAQMTGTTLFTVSRLLSAWEARGIVKPRREAVTVFDLQSLRGISEDR